MREKAIKHRKLEIKDRMEELRRYAPEGQGAA
jgi:hypothetical protein